MLDDLCALLTELRPDRIYITNEYDLHGDHAAAPLFVTSAIESIPDYQPLVFRYHVHGGDDERWPNRQGDYFVQPFNMPDSQWEIRLSVPVADKADFLETLKLFVSQWCDEEYMVSFIKDEQLFFAPVYRYTPDEA